MGPEPARAKDWVTHNLHWRRTGTFLPEMVYCSLTVRPLGFKGEIVSIPSDTA
jgi:hypothetical protein